jgi:hypothetical protein
MAAISAGAWVGMTEKAPDESGFLQRPSPRAKTRGPCPLLSRHPGRRPGVHVDRLKVAGDIPVLSGNPSAASSR